MLTGKSVVLGVSGGIAAYKAAEILRGLKQLGAEVTVVMTANAGRFVGPLTFEALSGRPVCDDLFSSRDASMEHLSLARRADLVLIAPATANTLARLAAGMADDLLTTLVLASTAPLLIAPAMNTRMWRHAATAANLSTLLSRGVHVIGPDSGPLAEEESGPGRLSPPGEIVRKAADLLLSGRDLAGLRFLVTAGPTREAVDPVRFVSNASSGKMGFAVAARALARGAVVTLVHGPVCLEPPGGAKAVPVVTAAQMLAAVEEHFDESNVLVMTAAVADYRPAETKDRKIKKARRGGITLEMVATEDILGKVGRRKGGRILAGFAAETGPPAKAAREKLKEKDLDLIVANDVTAPGAGFGSDTNRVQIFPRRGRPIDLPLLPKAEVADRILDEIAKLLGAAGKSGRKK